MIYEHIYGKKMQPWYRIQITEVGSSKFVTFHTRIHMNKVHKPSFSFSNKFTDGEILRDATLYTWVTDRFGNVHMQH